MSDEASSDYFLYRSIQSQPDAFREVVSRNRDLLRDLVPPIRSARRLYLTGLGTSFHAAQIGAYAFRALAPEIEVVPMHAFDFCNDAPLLSPSDVLIAVSHRGSKRFTREAQSRAASAGCCTAMITGTEVSPPEDVAFHFTTVEQEKSSAHTISHVCSVALLMEVARQCADRPVAPQFVDDTIPAALTNALATEMMMQEWAAKHRDRRAIWLIGAGPTHVVARETALKIKETSYKLAEGQSVEELLHGPFQCCDRNDLFVLLANGVSEIARERLESLATMIADIEAHAVVVTDTSRGFPGIRGDSRCVVPAVSTPAEALIGLIPMQLFTYHLALQSMTNPDNFRLDDPRFARAISRITL